MEEIDLERISDYNLAYMNKGILKLLREGNDYHIRQLGQYERKRLLRYGLVGYEWPRGYFLTKKGARLLKAVEQEEDA